MEKSKQIFSMRKQLNRRSPQTLLWLRILHEQEGPRELHGSQDREEAILVFFGERHATDVNRDYFIEH